MEHPGDGGLTTGSPWDLSVYDDTRHSTLICDMFSSIFWFKLGITLTTVSFGLLSEQTMAGPDGSN